MASTESSPRQTVRPTRTRTRFTPKCRDCQGTGKVFDHPCDRCADPCESCGRAGHCAGRCPAEIENEDSGY